MKGKEKGKKGNIQALLSVRFLIHSSSLNALCKSLDKVVDNVVDMLDTDRDPDEVLCDPRVELLLFRELFVSC